MDLINIKEYVQKTAVIISTIAEMQVLISNAKCMIIGDSKDGIINCEKFSILTQNSMLAETIKSRKMVITEDSKNNFHGCKNCPSKEKCDINAMISIPIINDSEVLGGIGIYAQKKEDVKRLIKKHSDFIEFTHRMSELLIMKLKEESKTLELQETVKKLQNNSCNIPFEYIIGRSREIMEVKKCARQFAKGNSTILIQGESGTGKEIFARAIHTVSQNSNGPFVAINCAALPDNLIESELFGYEEGAFTGAMKGGRIGKFELSDKGTLFLDEIGEFPIHLQAKLLRSLQDKKIQRIGGNKEINIDVRILAATNRDLDILVQNGQFREDLYYRLNVIPIRIPTLKERRADIEVLAEHFLRIYTKALHKDIFGFDKATMNVLYEHDWPGNIRELQNAIEYAVNISADSYITVNDLPKKILNIKEKNGSNLQLRPLKYVEDEYIREALRVYGETLEGKKKAAQVLGIGKSTLYRKLKNM